MSQAVRHIWVLSLNHCAAVYDAMSSLSGLTVKSSEQHVDMGISRRKRDLEDCTLFIEWFKNHNPFTIEDSDLHLHSLSSGLVSINTLC